MKIMWVTAQVLPLVADDLKIKKNGFGGWVMNMLNELKTVDDIELSVVMVSNKVTSVLKTTHEKIICYVAPEYLTKDISELDRDSIVKDFSPDIIHIEGNEFGIHNSFSKLKNIPVLLSLQGILSGYEQYQYGEIPIADYLFSPKSGNMISAWILYLRKHLLFNKRISVEEELIKNVKFISGRPFWDRAHSYWINPEAKYFSCNRILRPIFYKQDWNLEQSEKHTVFVGNGYSPLKGLHNVIMAATLLVREYPDLKIYVAGESPIVVKKGFSLHRLGYSNFIKKLIKKYHLENVIVFTGALLGDEMVKCMKKCHLYCLPSLIENSPNTLGEAMMIGMPCVSAYTGGASEMAIDEEECLFYRANDPKLLAWQIRRVFNDDELAKKLGEKAQIHAKKTHDPKSNRDALLQAYYSILNLR